MKQQKVKLYTYASKFNFEGEFSITTSTYLPTTDGSQMVIPITDIEVSIPLPEVSKEMLVNGEIGQLRKAMKEDQKKAFERQKYWEDRISKLQAIEAK